VKVVLTVAQEDGSTGVEKGKKRQPGRSIPWLP